VKPAPFDYYAPRTLDEALALLAEHGGDAKPLAGGQSLIPAMNFRLATPTVLVDLNAISELSYVGEENTAAAADNSTRGSLRIGAMTRHHVLERSELVARQAPLVTMTMPFVAHAAIRTRGTIGGSLAHADPAAELPAVMLALNATLTLTSRIGTRTVAAEDFFTSLFTTALEPGELVTEIGIPSQVPASGYAFHEIARRHGDFALAGVAVVLEIGASQRITNARVALLSVGDRPLLAAHAVRTLLGQAPTADVIRAAAEDAATRDIDPPSDIHASSAYRRQLVRVLTRRALEDACRTRTHDA
jgi:carbon-monoxide dehydrogenase medium subunit